MRRGLSKPSAPDYFFIGLVVILVIFGLVMLASASSDLAKIKFGNSYYYLKHQISYGLSLGAIGFLGGMFFYYRRWEKIATPLLIASVALLLLVFSPLGFITKGSARWLEVAGFSFQPSELLKLTFLVYLSAWISKSQARSRSLTQGLLPFLFLIGAVAVLLFLQPSTTTVFIIFGASLLMYFAAGAKFKFIIVSILLAGLVLSMLIIITPYRLKRFIGFLQPEVDPLGRTYHINQALIAIGSGGLTGVGFGQSTSKLKFLPEPLADSIFAIIAEELGFVGGITLILAFLFFIWRGLMIARKCPDNFGRFLAVSFISLIGFQTFINIGAVSGLLPLTGVSLPFISYGSTALAVFLTMSGIIANISKYKK